MPPALHEPPAEVLAARAPAEDAIDVDAQILRSATKLFLEDLHSLLPPPAHAPASADGGAHSPLGGRLEELCLKVLPSHLERLHELVDKRSQAPRAAVSLELERTRAELERLRAEIPRDVVQLRTVNEDLEARVEALRRQTGAFIHEKGRLNAALQAAVDEAQRVREEKAAMTSALGAVVKRVSAERDEAVSALAREQRKRGAPNGHAAPPPSGAGEVAPKDAAGGAEAIEQLERTIEQLRRRCEQLEALLRSRAHAPAADGDGGGDGGAHAPSAAEGASGVRGADESSSAAALAEAREAAATAAAAAAAADARADELSDQLAAAEEDAVVARAYFKQFRAELGAQLEAERAQVAGLRARLDAAAAQQPAPHAEPLAAAARPVAPAAAEGMAQGGAAVAPPSEPIPAEPPGAQPEGTLGEAGAGEGERRALNGTGAHPARPEEPLAHQPEAGPAGAQGSGARGGSTDGRGSSEAAGHGEGESGEDSASAPEPVWRGFLWPRLGFLFGMPPPSARTQQPDRRATVDGTERRAAPPRTRAPRGQSTTPPRAPGVVRVAAGAAGASARAPAAAPGAAGLSSDVAERSAPGSPYTDRHGHDAAMADHDGSGDAHAADGGSPGPGPEGVVPMTV